MNKQTLNIEGMHCGGCAMNVEGALEDLTGVRSVKVSLPKQTAEVEFDEKQVNLAQLITAVQQAGYQATPA